MIPCLHSVVAILIYHVAEVPNYPIRIVPRVGRGREVVPLVQLSTQHSTARPAASARPEQAAERQKQGTRKEYKRAVYSPTRTKRAVKRQAQPEGSVPTNTTATKTDPATTKPTEKPTVSVKKLDELSLKDYKPLPPKQAALVRKLQKKEKRLLASSPSKEKQRKFQWFENSAPNETTKELQSSSPQSRIVGTGYHHLPASSDKPTSFSSPPAGPPTLPAQARENIKGLTPVLAKFTPKNAEGKRQVKSLYPWLPSDRADKPLKNLGVAFKERKTKWQMPPVRHKGKERSKKDKHVEIEE